MLKTRLEDLYDSFSRNPITPVHSVFLEVGPDQVSILLPVEIGHIGWGDRESHPPGFAFHLQIEPELGMQQISRVKRDPAGDIMAQRSQKIRRPILSHS